MFRKYSFSEEINENLNADWNWEDFNQDSNSKLTKKKRSSYFTQEEDYLLCQQVEQQGKKWKKIALLFPNKTDRMLRNRFLKLQHHSEITENTSSPKLDLSCHEVQQYHKKQKLDNEQICNQFQQLNSIKQKIDLITILVKQTKIEMLTLLQQTTL